jgi:hypothetical protein
MRDGTDNCILLKHVNMNRNKDNLYLVCSKNSETEMDEIMLVQAEPYDVWYKDVNVSSKINVQHKGEWYCTYLVPYYKDTNVAVENCRWRYEVHRKMDKGGDLSEGYCSFDDRFHRGGGYCKELLDSGEIISLFPYPKGRYVYGPFSWSEKNEFKIDPKIWIHAMPHILRCKTETGPLFWNGFSSALLLKAADFYKKRTEVVQLLNPKVIADAKRSVFLIPDSKYLPISYTEREPGRRKKLNRFVICPGKTRYDYRPYLFEEGSDSNDGNGSTNTKKRKKLDIGWKENRRVRK